MGKKKDVEIRAPWLDFEGHPAQAAAQWGNGRGHNGVVNKGTPTATRRRSSHRSKYSGKKGSQPCLITADNVNYSFSPIPIDNPPMGQQQPAAEYPSHFSGSHPCLPAAFADNYDLVYINNDAEAIAAATSARKQHQRQLDQQRRHARSRESHRMPSSSRDSSKTR